MKSFASRAAGLLKSGSRVLVALSIVALAQASHKQAQAEEITLKAIAPWAASVFFTKPLLVYQDWVNSELKGKVQIKYLGASDVVPAFEQFEALRNKVVDLQLGSPGYFTGQLPIVQATQFSTRSKAELRKNGYFDILKKIYHDQAQIVLLAETGGIGGQDFRYVFKNKITKLDDIKGLKLRASQTYVPHMKALGASPVIMKPSEMYTGLERGIVDGLGWARMGLRDFALPEVTKYILNVPFFTVQTPILMNLEAWNKIPADAQRKMEELGEKLETWSEEYYAKAYKNEDVKLKEAGMVFVRLSAAEEKEFLRRAYDVSWKQIVSADPVLGPKLEQLGR